MRLLLDGSVLVSVPSRPTAANPRAYTIHHGFGACCVLQNTEAWLLAKAPEPILLQGNIGLGDDALPLVDFGGLKRLHLVCPALHDACADASIESLGLGHLFNFR